MLPVSFYIPKKDWPQEFPESPNEPWKGFSYGIYCWTLQTYLHLREQNFPCQLVDALPDKGIVVAHRDSFPYGLKPASDLLMVCIKADRNPHPYAQAHIVQNPEESKFLPNAFYIPLWPQPGLIKRDPKRGCRVENVAYMGITHNLASELQAQDWQDRLQQIGLNWQIRPRAAWHDYSDVDVVLAVRNFDNQDPFYWKPATKLYNAWHARVPAVLGRESAFRAERKGELDYFEVKTPDEALKALKQLKEDPQLYQSIVVNGKMRSQEKSQTRVKQIWQETLTQKLIPQYEAWCHSPGWKQSLYIGKCFANIRLHGFKRRLSISSRD
jgi:hypothetical protein